MYQIEVNEVLYSPCGAISFLDLMLKFELDNFSHAYRSLCTVSKDMQLGDMLDSAPESPEYCANIAAILDSLLVSCKLMEMDQTLLLQMENLSSSLKSDKADRRSSVLQVQLFSLVDGVHSSLGRLAIYLVPQSRASVVSDVAWFEKLMIVFPHALIEIFEMKFCYAFGRNTATVFHAMRAAEVGLRHIAKKLRVKISDGKKACPIEFGTWDKVINAVNNKIKELHQTAKSPKRVAYLAFYAESASQCAYMKDIWRNETAHTRRRYTEPEALAVMGRVIDFLNLLAIGPDAELKKVSRSKSLTGPASKALSNSIYSNGGKV